MIYDPSFEIHRHSSRQRYSLALIIHYIIERITNVISIIADQSRSTATGVTATYRIPFSSADSLRHRQHVCRHWEGREFSEQFCIPFALEKITMSSVEEILAKVLEPDNESIKTV